MSQEKKHCCRCKIDLVNDDHFTMSLNLFGSTYYFHLCKSCKVAIGKDYQIMICTKCNKINIINSGTIVIREINGDYEAYERIGNINFPIICPNCSYLVQ